MLEAIYKNICPRCGGDITSFRLSRGEFCDECMKNLGKNCEDLGKFRKFCEAKEKVRDFEEFFELKTKSTLTSIQRMWAMRFFLGNSFALVAPTGIGKSTFGLLLSAYVNDSYLLFPTKLLVNEALKKLEGLGIEALAYRGKEKELIKKGEYNILITTTQFFYKNRDLIDRKFSLVFVDDVDSVFKSYKRVEEVLSLVKGNLIVSSATAKPRGNYFKKLGFDVGGSFNLRNIEDLWSDFSWDESIEWIERLGRNGLIFVRSKSEVYEYIEFLASKGIRAYSYEEFEEHLDEFKKGECYFVGIGSYKNPLARGVDIPEVRYTLFVGVPKLEFRVQDGFRAFYFIALAIMPYVKEDLRGYIEFMKRYLYAKNISSEIQERLNSIVEEIKKIVKRYQNFPNISFDGEKFIVADVTGYIQASGRASRFYKGHLTKGISLVLVDNKKAFYSLRKKLKFRGIDFKKVDEVDLKEILKEVDESRKVERLEEFKTTFLIVESPTKAKTISNFFGRASKRLVDGVILYEVLMQGRVLITMASIGHDFDLVEDDGVWGVAKKYVPIFKLLENKENILRAFNLQGSEVEEVIIATDPDREGEKIAFDLSLNIKPYNLNVKRAEFHEITKYAFIESIENLREVDLDLVASQFVRRVADRWIGFKVSSFLQKTLNNQNLSAGRVQTPVLEWICERTKSLKEKVFVTRLEFDGVVVEFEDEKKEFFENIDLVEVKKIDETIETLIEKPFTTSELLKEASIRLKFSPQKTMKLAQELFEKGFITYHRTDSHRISSLGISIAKEYLQRFEGMFKPRSFEENGAHEAIRATFAMDRDELESYLIERGIELGREHLRLYDLIFRKFIASQMKEVKVKKEKFKILNKEFEFITEIVEDGFNLIYPVKVYEIKEGIKRVNKKIFKKSKYPPFSYADIIEMMKNRGIGRPSTYAITIEKLLVRRYVKEKNGYLFATRLGFKVVEVIKNSKYYEFVNEEFTKKLEEVLDRVDKKSYKDELIKLYSLLF